MIRKIAVAGAAGAMALTGLAIAGGSAGAAPITVTNATSANIHCNITAKATLTPKLKNNWVAADHNGDANDPDGAFVETNVHVKAIPNTTFSAGLPVQTKATGKSTSCTGSATDGTNTATVVSLKLVLTPGTNAVDNPPTAAPGTCDGLLAGTAPEDVPATYGTALTFKTTGAKLAGVNITGSTIAPSGLGFAISGGTLSGSISGPGSSSVSQANVDSATVAAVTAAPANSGTPVPSSTACQASLKIKNDTPTKPGSATLKGPKGFGKIAVGIGLDTSQSTIAITK